ncbi:MAG: CinA family protein [Planctomycetes bacterium]|nr:CinA family protein [Planctomycetota bacterium]
MTQPLSSLVEQVAGLLKSSQTRIVFAESCTAGLVSAALGRVPGISEFHCGSAVVYRLDTKTRWLGVDSAILRDPGPVSSVVAIAMARGVLARTPEAQMSAAITGHLGPNAPAEQDGLVFVGIGQRQGQTINVQTKQYILPAEISGTDDFAVASLREWRQWKAAEHLLEQVREAVQQLR